MTDEERSTKTRIRLSQETIAIVTVGIALAGLNLVTTGDLRDLRKEWQTESRQHREQWQAENHQYRDEARADREAFQREIRRLTQGQAELAALITPILAPSE